MHRPAETLSHSYLYQLDPRSLEVGVRVGGSGLQQTVKWEDKRDGVQVTDTPHRYRVTVVGFLLRRWGAKPRVTGSH